LCAHSKLTKLHNTKKLLFGQSSSFRCEIKTIVATVFGIFKTCFNKTYVYLDVYKIKTF
jgi:hypothetical protein